MVVHLSSSQSNLLARRSNNKGPKKFAEKCCANKSMREKTALTRELAYHLISFFARAP